MSQPIDLMPAPVRRHPDWIRVRAPFGEEYTRLKGLVRTLDLHTVCEEAMCPNVGECWGAGTLTIMDYVHIPVIWDSPQISDLTRFYEAMEQNRDKRIYVHCQVNYRASSFLYLYRLKYLGVDEKQARQDLQWIWAPNPTWTTFIAQASGLP